MNFFPIASNVGGLFIDTGKRERWGGKISVRNEERWHVLGAERDIARLIAAAWCANALTDGWTISPTYANEDIDQSATLKLFHSPQGLFKAQIITRQNKFTGETWSLGAGEVNCYGPDELTIPVPLEYPGQQYFRDALVTCPHCHTGPNRSYFNDAADIDDKPRKWAAARDPVATKRYSFAGRACEACLPELKRKHEKPGWYN